jgi:hypothetical protein
MIPVMAEPMALPAGAWSTEAVNIKEPVSETAQELATLINQQLQITAKDALKDQKLHTKKDVRRKASSIAFPTTNHNSSGRRIMSLGRYAPIGFLLILFAGVLVYYAWGKHPIASQGTNTQPLASNLVVSAFQQSYKVSVPGPGCNTNHNDWWSVGNRYKALGTPTATAKNTNSAPKETPTPYVVMDNSTVAACQQHGLYVQHTDHYDAFAEIFFGDDTQEALPQHFSTQITETALNPSAAATFLLGVRHQNSEVNSEDSGYGDDTLEIGVDGSWQTARTNNVTDQEDTIFTRGYSKPAQTMILGAEVDGPRITFSVNGQQVTTIVDTTYPSGYSIGFGLSDSDAKSAPSALYSNFSYQPLINTQLTKQAAVATATAQANANLHAPYTAVVPGPGCDQGPGQWQPVTKDKNYATASCQANGLAVSQDASTQYNGYVSFYGLDGNLPTDYSIKVQIDTSQISDGCAGIMTRTDRQAAGYSFMVCSNGYWSILRYDSAGGQGHQLAEGYVDQQTSYTMVATSNGDAQSLALDDVTVSTVHDATLQTTNNIELIMYAGQNTAGTALFSNFVFTPLS